MSTRLPRRSLIGTLGIVVTAGCLSDESTDDDRSEQTDESRDDAEEQPKADDGGSDEVPDECDLQPRTNQGEAEPIEMTVTIDRADDEEVDCARAAAEAALDRLDDAFDLDLTDPRPNWIAPLPQRDGDGYRAEISVVAEMQSEETGDGTSHLCPPPAFDFDEAIEAVPREVTVTLEFEDGEYECTHEVWVTQEQRHLD